ncbi:glycosyltransferase family 4 protein [Haloterrigena sp. SYSU A558-1]|uniref:Glycosyltransferase family 4 protein n=1 Tax=Haloterrigena gelatinilytica TaxID=2741724 RepID=A0ABX2LDY7_9EURY|nr:glycosyltransferase family 4 protein [Haloterrigena gelatinilytica]NUC72765.1 glycosyltransferase family 4 protein [Haloterrigena gelatinilytica]
MQPLNKDSRTLAIYNPMSNKILLRSHTSLREDDVSGGAARLMKNLARALSETGWDVHILSPASLTNEYDNQSDISYIEFDYGNPQSSLETIINTVRGVSTYRETIKDENYNIILDDISHFPYYPMHLSHPEETVNAVFMHTAFFGAAREYVGPLRGTVIEFIDRTLPYLNNPEIICAGSGTADRIHRKTGYSSTHILHPCIDMDKFEYNFMPESSTILYLGRLGERKNVSCLLRAWRIIENKTERDVSLVIAGSGPKMDELRRLSVDLGLTNIDFLGYVEESEKQRLFEESLLYVLPSKMEGYVTTGIEALATGTPVVGSDTFGINDYIQHGETGYLFPVNDHEELARQVLDLVSNPKQMRPIAERGRELALQHSYEEFKLQADNLFSEII